MRERTVTIPEIGPHTTEAVRAYQDVRDAISVQISGNGTACTRHWNRSAGGVGCTGFASPQQNDDPVAGWHGQVRLPSPLKSAAAPQLPAPATGIHSPSSKVPFPSLSNTETPWYCAATMSNTPALCSSATITSLGNWLFSTA